jgi:hypothetical protein
MAPDHWKEDVLPKLGVSHDGVGNSSHWVTPFSANTTDRLNFHDAKCESDQRWSQVGTAAIIWLTGKITSTAVGTNA